MRLKELFEAITSQGSTTDPVPANGFSRTAPTIPGTSGKASLSTDKTQPQNNTLASSGNQIQANLQKLKTQGKLPSNLNLNDITDALSSKQSSGSPEQSIVGALVTALQTPLGTDQLAKAITAGQQAQKQFTQQKPGTQQQTTQQPGIK